MVFNLPSYQYRSMHLAQSINFENIESDELNFIGLVISNREDPLIKGCDQNKLRGRGYHNK